VRDPERDEPALVALARQGDRQAFRSLVRAHQEALYAFALRLVLDEADAMDLVQETFIAAWKGLARFRGESRLSTWLYGIALRKAETSRRGARRRMAREATWAREHFDADSVRRAMPEAVIDLERALVELPVRMRTALVLHCIHGWTQREVAEAMGVAEGTVKAHVHAARRLLKEKLNRERS
jgi:RNA polymerase sigma-70 factor (ECF subfamily)